MDLPIRPAPVPPASRLWRLAVVWLAVTGWAAVRGFAAFADATLRPERRAPVAVRVPLDRASLAELRLLPGIGPERAEAIVLHRVRAGPPARLEDLLEVPGIGSRTLAAIAPYVRVGPAPPP